MKLLHNYYIDADVLPKVLNVLELILQFSDKRKVCKNALNDPYSVIHFNQCKSARNMGQYCQDLVTECILNHRYEEAAKLYWILSQDKSIFEQALFKIGIILLSNLETNDKNGCFVNFFRSMLDFPTLNKKEILLEFIMCAMKYEFPDIPRQVKEVTNRKVLSMTRKHEKIDSIFDTYMTLLEWYKDFSGDMNMSQGQTRKENVKLKKCGENSDILILNLVNVLILQGRQNEIENELISHVESNPDNINALIYVSTYLHHCHPDSEKLVNYLEILAEKCISDVRTLWLIKIWGKRGVSLLKILNYSFMFLDYPTNGKNTEAWKALWKNLKKAQRNLTEQEFESVHSLWKPRMRSWSWMYFNPQRLPNMQSKDRLIAHKVAFLLFFADGKKYIKKVSKYHPDALALAESLRN